MRRRRKESVFITDCCFFLLVLHLKHSPQIIDEHHQTSCGILGSSHLLPHVLFCLQLGIGLVGKERRTVRMTGETRSVSYCCGNKRVFKSIKVEWHVNNKSQSCFVQWHTGFIGVLTFWHMWDTASSGSHHNILHWVYDMHNGLRDDFCLQAMTNGLKIH